MAVRVRGINVQGSGVGGPQRTSTSHGRHKDAVVGEVGRCQAVEALEDNQRQLEPHTLGRNVTSAGWQVTLCDPIWHVSSRSGVATLRTAIHLLLTYLLTYPEINHDGHLPLVKVGG